MVTSTSTPAIDTWKASVSGNWSVASNWSLNAIPTSGEDVVIDSTLPLTVTFNVSGLLIGALSLIGDALNLEGGTLSVSGATTLQNATVDGVDSFDTRGATSVAGATIGGSVHWINSGTVTQTGGTVTIGDGSSSAAVINNLAGATWIVTDGSGLGQGLSTGSRFVNAGTYWKTSTGVTSIIKATFISTGTISSEGGGDIEFEGAANLSGTYIGSGMVDYGPGGVSTIEDVDVTASCCQTNETGGVVNLVGTMTMNDGSTLANSYGARWNFDGDSSLVLAAGQGEGPDIYGPGLIAKTAGTGTSLVSIDVFTTGTVSVATGTLDFAGTSSQFSGPITGAGTFELDGVGATLEAAATISVAHWTLAGGMTTIDGMLVYTGSAKQSGGGVTLGDGTATHLARLTVGAGGSWDFAEAGAILLGADASSIIVISASATHPGLLETTGAGVSTVAPGIVNDGLDVGGGALGGIEAAAGTLDIKNSVWGTGSDNIVGASKLEFDGYVAKGQTVDFSGAGGTLDLTDLGAFYAPTNGFDTTGSNDVLLIGGGWTLQGASEGASATVLTFAEGSARHTITLNGAYTTPFTATPLGGGVLQVTY